MEKAGQKIRKPRQKRGIETRSKILEAAKTLFSQKGFHSTNSKEIAAEAGVAIGTFYAYFKDKKQVFLEVLSLHIQEAKGMILDRLRSIDFSTEPLKRTIFLLVKTLYEAHDLSPAFHREAEVMRYSDPEVAELHRSFEVDFFKDFTSILRANKEKLRVTDIEAAARLIMLASEEIIHSIKISGPADMAEDRLLEGLADMIGRFLLP